MRLFLFLLFALPACLFCATASAEATSSLDGGWRYAGNRAEVNRMEASLEDATSELSRVIRSFARRRLREISLPWKTLRIQRSANQVAIAVDGDVIASPLGKVVRKQTSDGPLTVRRTIHDGTLVEEFEMERGGRTNKYHINGDVVRVESVIHSPKLAEPIRFSYTYR